jgi:hypothetical protein
LRAARCLCRLSGLNTHILAWRDTLLPLSAPRAARRRVLFLDEGVQGNFEHLFQGGVRG